MIQRVIVAGGGTGGHLFPGIAVVEELRRHNPSLEVLFVGTERGIESRVVPGMGEKLETLDVTPLKGRTFAQLLGSLAKLPSAWGRAMSIVRQHRPDLVLGVGGYASGPMLVAAASMGIKTALLEQNAHVGLTNRVLARVVGRAYLSFDETAPQFGRAARVVGNPVRRAFVEASRRALVDPRGSDMRARRILVIGGSQGAQRLNEIVPEALARLGLQERGIEVVHQTGAKMRDEVAARYAALGVKAEVVPFIDDVARAYASASFVICRAGASTLAELAAIGRPAILVPFPFAADDHQAKNAESFEKAGAAVCLRESVLDADRLASEARALLDDADRRTSMSAAMRSRGRPDAAASIVDDLVAWIDGEPVTPLRGGQSPESAALDDAREDDDGDATLTPTAAIARAIGARAEQAPSVSGYRARPVVDFRRGRELRMDRPATTKIPRLVIEPYVAPLRASLAN
ncbi:MAG: undecaprenyldiphospho-muramoylpentapeptide beta-N-acetylglucosaminyltransferase [Deltaproteobacteria bacterium]|nr:undecaprenyldiphospho-muramoylpentapeptide beta-N-acetylglucosaminyltransferase [Deltaproteobacteria bacterium]